MVVLLRRRRPHHAALVQEVAVDLGAVEGAVRDLDLDEVALHTREEDSVRLFADLCRLLKTRPILATSAISASEVWLRYFEAK